MIAMAACERKIRTPLNPFEIHDAFKELARHWLQIDTIQ